MNHIKFVAALLLVAVLGFTTACKDTPEGPTYTISVSNPDTDLTVGDEVIVNVTVNPADGFDFNNLLVTFSEKDIVRLERDGGNFTLTAEKEGETTMTIQFGEFKKDIDISVASKPLLNMVTITGGEVGLYYFKVTSPDENNQYPIVFKDEPTYSNVNDFKMSETEITQKQWYEVMGNDGFGADKPNSKYGKGDNFPMYYVSWLDAVVFCNRLSIAEGKEPCYYYKTSYEDNNQDYDRITNVKDPNTLNYENKLLWCTIESNSNKNGYRLPTDNEWIYAARGGKTFTYAGSNDANEVAWTTNNAQNTTHDVKTKAPNGYKLYDMSGNVKEWNDSPSSSLDGNLLLPICFGDAFDTKPIAIPTKGPLIFVYHLPYSEWPALDPTTRDKSIGFRVVCKTGTEK